MDTLYAVFVIFMSLCRDMQPKCEVIFTMADFSILMVSASLQVNFAERLRDGRNAWGEKNRFLVVLPKNACSKKRK